MKRALAGLTILVSAFASFSTAWAQAPEINSGSYILVVGKTTDRAKIGAYAASLPSIYASLDAYYVAIGGAGRGVTWLEGPWKDRSLILGKFPSRAAVDAFWWGEPYRAAIRKRDNAGVFSVVTLNGIAPLQYEGANAAFLIVMTAPRDGSPNQLRRSELAAATLRSGVEASGGQMITPVAQGQFTSLEGDTVFDRFAVAAWPTIAARDAYLASRLGKRAAQLRAGLGMSAVAAANGVARNQLPPAATPQTNNK
jgi:uncharacterized protein (DUF1330 family)